MARAQAYREDVETVRQAPPAVQALPLYRRLVAHRWTRGAARLVRAWYALQDGDVGTWRRETEALAERAKTLRPVE